MSAFELQLEAYSDPFVRRPVRQFGYEVFGRPQPVSFEAAVGADYVIGTGDELVISLWGSVDRDFRLIVDREGQVRLPVIGPVPLKGLTLARAEEELKRRFDQQYRNYELQVRLGRIRDMTVHVIGRVVRPGRVRIPAIGTLFDALGAAGGITKDGTLRKIRLRRAGEEDRVVDLYTYLLEGSVEADVTLRPRDVIVVGPVGARVAIAGRVLRPAIYELSEDSIDFASLLGMAGGYARLANTRGVQIESVMDGEREVRMVDFRSQPPERVLLHDGDVAIVGTANPRLENVVYVAGNVSMPGRYAWRPGMRVSDVINEKTLIEAGFWMKRSLPGGSALEEGRAAERIKGLPSIQKPEEAGQAETKAAQEPFVEYPEPYLEYALIRRLDPKTLQEERIPFHLGKAIFERDPKEDHVLQSQDTIIVFSRDAFVEPETVFISGAVHKPGEHRYFEGMRIRDLVRMAGGPLPEAYLKEAVLTRIHPEETGTRYEHIEVGLEAALAGDPEANLELRPNDALAVKLVPEFHKTYRVRIEGEVRHPGVYAVYPGERLSDLLERAGGFTGDAYLPAAQFYRQSVRKLQQERIDESLRQLELETKLAAQRFTAEAQAAGEEIDVQAEQARIERLIATIRAHPAKGRMVIRLRRDPTALRGTPDDIELADGDRLVVPRQPQEVHVVGAVFNQTALLYQKGLTARDYLEECGGATDTADLSIAYVIRADGTADSARSARKGYRWDAERGRFARGDLLSTPLYPGDTLVIPYDVKPRLSSLGLTKTVTQILFQAALATGVVVALL